MHHQIEYENCTVPPPGVDQSQSQRRDQGQHVVRPCEGVKEEVNRIITQGVAKEGRRRDKASPRQGAAKIRRRQTSHR